MDCFDILCQRMIIHVGENNFKSEAYIDAFPKGEEQHTTFEYKSNRG